MQNENDPEAIREEIAATRERIADTAEALAYKTDVPARVKETVSERVETVKAQLGDAAATTRSNVADLAEQAKSVLSNAAVSAKATLSDATDSARSTLADVTATAKAKVGDGAANVVDLAQRTRSDVGVSGFDGPSAGSPSLDAIARFARENPLGLALGSIALGFIVGLLLPVSDLERDNVGPLGDRVADQAKAAANDTLAQGKAAVVHAVTDAFTQSTTHES